MDGHFNPPQNGFKLAGLGHQDYNERPMFRYLLIGQWHNLSDPKLEENLPVRFDFMLFLGLELHGTVPDEATHCRFHNALVKAEIFDALLTEICRQIEDHGLKAKEANAAIIDATLIESATHPRTHIEAPAEELRSRCTNFIQTQGAVQDLHDENRFYFGWTDEVQKALLAD